MLAGWAFFVPVLSWSGIYVGKFPWFALATLQALYVGAMCAVVGFVGHRLRPRWGDSAYAVLPLAWVAQELARGTHTVRRLPLGAARVQPGRQPARQRHADQYGALKPRLRLLAPSRPFQPSRPMSAFEVKRVSQPEGVKASKVPRL